MNKVYTRINWQNYPTIETPINESNLNKIDYAMDEIDTRVVQHETTKANVSSLNELINSWTIDETTGVITITKVSGEQIIFDLNIEKVPVGFSMTEDGILIMTTDDGTEFKANIGSMIPVLTFQDTDEITVSVTGEGVNKTYSFSIKTGSIKEDKLQTNFLADCRLYAGNAENSANLAGEYAAQAKESAESISDKVDILGTIKTSSLMVSTVKTATNTIISSITLEPGIWLIKGEFRWDGNANGLRSTAIIRSSITPEYTLPSYNNSNIVVPPSGAGFCQSVNVIINVSEETTFNFWAAQSSGANIGIALGSMQAVRLSA